MSVQPPMSLTSALGSLFEPLLDSHGAAQLFRIHSKTLQRMARLTPTRANVRCSGKWHNRHWRGVGASRRGCRIGSSPVRLYWTDSKLGTLSRGICRRGLVDRLEQVGVHSKVQHTENGAMEER